VCIHVAQHAAYQSHKQSTHLVLPTAAVFGAHGAVAVVLTALKYTEHGTSSTVSEGLQQEEFRTACTCT
jgi:hypothetical protein